MPMESDAYESKLVVRAADGDITAVQQLLTRHHDRLVHIVEARIPADARRVLAAEDVCQDAYVAVFQQVSTLKDRSARTFSAWIEAVVERKLIDAVRALRAQKRGGGRCALPAPAEGDVASVADLLELVAVHERTPSRSVANREMIDGVLTALEDLNGDYQAVLRLRYLEGLSVAETANRIGRSGGAVSMLCHRGLEQLGGILRERSASTGREA